MYEIVDNNSEILDKNNLFYDSDTTLIYKLDNYLYKLYKKKEPHKRRILDYLIENYDNIKSYSIPPLNKLKYQDNYGMKMHYLDGIDFLDYSRQVSPKEMVRQLKILSKNLKELNKLNIKLTDLHHHNVLVRKEDNYPLYIDLDDANINELGSCHISYKSFYLHDCGNKDHDYRRKLIRYGNLDRECLFLFFMDYIIHKPLEKLSEIEFKDSIDKYFYDYFDKDFINALKELKDKKDNNDIKKYPYYIDDYLNDEESIVNSIKLIKRR